MVKNSVHPNITFRLCAILFAILAVGSLRAASPSSGHVNAATGSTFSWDGTATGSGSADESTCVDGVNCDVFMLNVDAGDYTGKIVQVEIHWTIPANDYDLYIHQGDLNGPVVASSAGGAPETSEIGRSTLLLPARASTRCTSCTLPPRPMPISIMDQQRLRLNRRHELQIISMEQSLAHHSLSVRANR